MTKRSHPRRYYPARPALVAVVFASVALVIAGSHANAGPIYTFTTIDLARPGMTVVSQNAFGINAARQVVGAVRYRPTGGGDTIRRGYVYDFTSGAFQLIDSTSIGGSGQAQATGINDAGTVVGRYVPLWKVDQNPEPDLTSGFVFDSTTGVLVSLDRPQFGQTVASAIDNSGIIYGRNREPWGGFIYDHGSWANFPDMPDGAVFGAMGVNDAGVVAGAMLPPGGWQAVLYGDSVYSYLTPPAACDAALAWEVNNQGWVVVECERAGARSLNYLFRNGVWLELPDVPGSTDTFYLGLNDEMWLTGYYYGEDGTDHAFVAQPVPEPATLVLTGAGLLLTGLRQRRRRS